MDTPTSHAPSWLLIYLVSFSDSKPSYGLIKLVGQKGDGFRFLLQDFCAAFYWLAVGALPLKRLWFVIFNLDKGGMNRAPHCKMGRPITKYSAIMTRLSPKDIKNKSLAREAMIHLHMEVNLVNPTWEHSSSVLTLLFSRVCPASTTALDVRVVRDLPKDFRQWSGEKSWTYQILL